MFDCGYVEVSSSQVMLRGIQVNRDQFPGVPLVHLYNGYVEKFTKFLVKGIMSC